MGRKSIAPKRKEEILDAFEISIKKHGFVNSTTRRIAAEANMNQPMISHYFGSKELLVKALLDRIMNQYMSSFQKTIGKSTGCVRVQKMLDFLFGPGLLGPDVRNNFLGQLLSAATHDKALRIQIKFMYESFLKIGEEELRGLYPSISKEDCKNSVYGILSLAIGNDVLLSTDIPYSKRLLAKKCAERLISSLETCRNAQKSGG